MTMAKGVRVGADACERAAGSRPACYQHGHHDGAQAKDSALDGGFNDVLLS